MVEEVYDSSSDGERYDNITDNVWPRFYIAIDTSGLLEQQKDIGNDCDSVVIVSRSTVVFILVHVYVEK